MATQSAAVTVGSNATSRINWRAGAANFAVQVEIPNGNGWVAKVVTTHAKESAAKAVVASIANGSRYGKLAAGNVYRQARNAKVVPATPMAEIPADVLGDNGKLLAWLQAKAAKASQRKPRNAKAPAATPAATPAAMPTTNA